jgi:predicted RNA-binding Zn-ribbon protein involved in translation (DUF1610 family)
MLERLIWPQDVSCPKCGTPAGRSCVWPGSSRNDHHPARQRAGLEAENERLTRLLNERGAPIPMLLGCPGCGKRHVDRGEYATKPHHTHACQECGMCWRPAIVATVGVRFLPGFKDRETS